MEVVVFALYDIVTFSAGDSGVDNNGNELPGIGSEEAPGGF